MTINWFKTPYSCVIFPLTQPQVAHQQQTASLVFSSSKWMPHYSLLLHFTGKTLILFLLVNWTLLRLTWIRGWYLQWNKQTSVLSSFTFKLGIFSHLVIASNNVSMSFISWDDTRMFQMLLFFIINTSFSCLLFVQIWGLRRSKSNLRYVLISWIDISVFSEAPKSR